MKQELSRMMLVATIPYSTPTPFTPISGSLPLCAGDKLSRAEFERRYVSMPDKIKAELVEGIVFMQSPVSIDKHGRPHAYAMFWATYYQGNTPGTDVGDNATIRLDQDNECQPDVLLRILPAFGGQTRADEDYIGGAPELVVEIAASSTSYDLHAKLNAYRRNGVNEYIVWRVLDEAIDWFVLRDSRFELMTAGETGVLRSLVFPGLWLDVHAMLRFDMQKLTATASLGLASDDHQQFVARLAEQRNAGK